LRKIYLQSGELLYEGFREKMFGIEQKNSGAILSANDKIGRGGPLAGEIRKELGDCNRERA